MSKKNRSVQGLRGLGALTVFIWHVGWYIDSDLGFTTSILFRGDFANLLFFLMSGFLLE